MREAWQAWAKRPEVEGTLVERARGRLPEMESTKRLVSLLSECYREGDRILDVGCNTGHYLRGVRRLDPSAEYVGVDAYVHYIDEAREIFADDPHARFEVKDVHDPLFPDDPFDLVYCCNVILHLPDFRTPLRNLLESTARTCIVRTLLGERTTKVRRAVVEEFDRDGEPLEFIYQNTWAEKTVVGYAHELGWDAEVIADEFDPSVLEREHETLKRGHGTAILGGRQVDGVVILDWKWLRFTRSD